MRDLIQPLHITAIALLCSLTTMMSCGEHQSMEEPLDGGRIHVHTRTSAVRPTQGAGHLGNGYGEVEVRSFPSANGHVRVWWAVTGADAPPRADNNANDVPDFVETVAMVGDDVLGRLTSKGWKTALPDETLNDGENGGDARFDIYLRNMTSGDGTFIREKCVQGGCAGYITIDNDFSNSNYKSLEEAARVLVSHEYFHAVQSAYSVDVEGWISEGTATWYEEIFYQDQDDFERLSNLYFEEHTRSLNDRVRGPVDGFSYAASLFFHFLSLSYDELVVQEIMKELTFDEKQTIAANRALEARGSSMVKAFQHFSVYNIFTGSRSTDKYSYPASFRYNQVKIKTLGTISKFDWVTQADAYASAYAIFDTNEDVVVSVKATDGKIAPNIALVSARTYGEDGKFELVEGTNKVRLSAEKAPYYIVVTGGETSVSGAVRVRPAPADMPMDDMGGEDMNDDMGGDMVGMNDMTTTPPSKDTDEDDGCSATGRASDAPPQMLWLVFGFGLFCWRRRVYSN